MPAASEFYEDDEPIEDVVAAFDAGEKQLTEPPPRGRTLSVDVARGTVTEGRNSTRGAPRLHRQD